MKYIITESQYKLLTEDLSIDIRRRLPFKNMMNDLEWSILEGMSPCEYDDIGEFVSHACDEMVNLYDDYFRYEHNKDMSPKDRDSLYYFFVDKFDKYLIDYHKKMCN